MASTIEPQWDVCVIGGGPAGATTATILAQAGHRVALFEREQQPRYHIGESLMPETYWTFKRIGILEKMQASNFTKKYSVQFVSANGRESQPFYFDQHKPHECSQTWQVTRSKFDRMMLDNAQQQGVVVHEGVRVLDVLFDGERAHGIKIQTSPDAPPQEISCRVVVDASGQSSVISRRVKSRVPYPDLRKGAVWTYFKGAYRDDGRNAGATMVMHTENKDGWFWYIPLEDDVVSIGIVSDFERLFAGKKSHEEIFNEQLNRCQAALKRVSGAERVADYAATKDYSYRSEQAAGDGWVLVGDAFAFLDPLYSSGVMLALKSGELAADAIIAGLEKNDLSGAQLGAWSTDYLRGVDRIRRLVCAYYDGFSFGQFLRRHPHFQGYITDMLIGDVFKNEVDEIFEPMDAMQAEMQMQ